VSEELDPEGFSEEVNNYYSSGVTDDIIGTDNIAGDPMLANTTATSANDAARGYVSNINDANVSSTIDDDILASGVTPGSFNIANMPINDNVVENQDISGDSSGVGFRVGSAVDNAVEPQNNVQQIPGFTYMPNHPNADVAGYVPNYMANQGV